MCHECFAIYEINDDLKTQLKRLNAQLTTITEERDIFARTLDKRDKELTAAQEELAAAEQRGIVNGLEMAAKLSAEFINCDMGCANVIAHAIRAKAEAYEKVKGEKG